MKSELTLKYGMYGLLILPCDFFMHVISPFLITLAAALTAVVVAQNLALVMPMILLVVVLLVTAALLCLVSRIMMPDKKITINPAAIAATFLSSQICLILSLPALLLGKYKWEKIEDVRTLWKQDKSS